jgi:nicotinamidase/pyrazinamidase
MRCLLVIDLQRDFLPGGALGVPEGDQVVPVANALMPYFELVLATKDWHPAAHLSFASQHLGRRVGEVVQLAGLPQILWPDHCIQHSPGAEFAPGLDTQRIQRVFWKGVDAEIDSYSGLFDNGRQRSTGLAEFLRERGVTEMFLLGLATDYCVKYTALDVLTLGLDVAVVSDGCRGVNLQPRDAAQALDAMQAAGARLIISQEVREQGDER